MNFQNITSELNLIPLDQKRTGFTRFISSWLYKGDQTYLIDVGPSASAPVLLDALETLKIRHLDGILLTHIHLDHAGGIREISGRFPETPIICHPKAIQHLADPTALWAGSLKTLGKIAELYGPMGPVPEAILRDGTRYENPAVEVLVTPGHAPHHLSFKIGPYLFAGEAGGVILDLPDGSEYLRPATPHRFILEISIESLDALIRIPHQWICFGHYGECRRTPGILHAHREQLYFWKKVIKNEMERNAGEDLVSRCLDRLLAEDSRLQGWALISSEIRQREKYFLGNSIRGYIGYLERDR